MRLILVSLNISFLSYNMVILYQEKLRSQNVNSELIFSFAYYVVRP